MCAQNVVGIEQEHNEVVSEFIEVFKANDLDKISSYILYPLNRESPIPPITNKNQFIKRFNEIFDDFMISKIINSDIAKDWHAVGYRGIMFENGVIWLNHDGKLIALNYQSEAEKKLKKKHATGLEKPIGKELDYGISHMRFVTSEGEIPNGCFGQLMTELNGDNSVAAIFVNRASLRGCITANFPYPGGVEEEVSYEINEMLPNHTYRLTVCQAVGGSMGSSCDKILVKFFNRDYIVKDKSIKVLSLEKIGVW